MKKLGVVLLMGALLIGQCACTSNTQQPSAGPSSPTGTEVPKGPEYIGNSYVQRPRVRDYTYSWWPESTGASVNRPFCVQTGWYGFGVNSATGSLTNFGAIAEEYNQNQALVQNMDVISSLPKVTTDASFTVGGKTYAYRGKIEKAPLSSTNMRMIESGQYMQSFDVAAMLFSTGDGTQSELVGRTEYKATPEYVAVNFELFSQQKLNDTKMTFGMMFSEGLTATQVNDQRILLKGEKGGYAVLLPNGGKLSYDSSRNRLAVEDTVNLRARKFAGVSMIVIPSLNPSEELFKQFDAVASLECSAEQTAPNEGKSVPMEFDATRGLWMVDTSRSSIPGGSSFSSDKYRNAYDGVDFTITNNSDVTVRIPLVFEKRNTFPVEGFAPMLRDIETGEPIGVPIQISKNWHTYGSDVTTQDWYKGLDGNWFLGTTYLEIPAGKSVSYEYINAFNQWGTVNLASHSQLCLIGWPSYHTHQIWHTSTIGSSGESFCYDPDLSCGYGFINDVRGVGYDPFESGKEFVWGGNNGGGNFLYYGKDGRNKSGSDEIVGLKNVKVYYKTYAPNMAEVVFQGITEDNAVEFTFTTYIARTNDVSRATHTFEYKFVKDVSFERMAFYQFGADNHNSGRWRGLTIGNENGPVEYQIDGVTYGAEAEIPVLAEAGYIGGKGMQQVEIPGERLWIAYTDSYQKVNSDYFDCKVASRMLSVLSFEAKLNGKDYSKPSVSLRSTEMFCGDSTLVELNPPAEVGKTIQAGSTVKGAVEYINLPPSKKGYYYTSEIIKNSPDEEFDTWKLAYRYAMGDKTTATAVRGEVVRQYPIMVQCAEEENGVIAQVSIKGGISYIPVTFSGVPIYHGYRLEKKVGDAWEQIDQSVIGNDYWQTVYRAQTGDYEITFNVEHSGDPNAVYEYRLVKK